MSKSQQMVCVVCVLVASACAKSGGSRGSETAVSRAAETTSSQMAENRAEPTSSDDQSSEVPPVPELRLEENNRMSESLPGMGTTTPVGPGVAALPSSPPLPGPSSEQIRTAPMERSPRTSAPPEGARTLTDGQILKIIGSVDQAEVEQARVIQTKSKNDRVRAFAQHMITDHSRSKQKGDALERSGKVRPEASELGNDLAKNAEAILQKLKQASGDELDRRYAQDQVDQHQRVLDLIKNKLLPNASSAELKAHLEDARSMVAEHFEDAQELKQQLIRSASSKREEPAPTASR